MLIKLRNVHKLFSKSIYRNLKHKKISKGEFNENLEEHLSEHTDTSKLDTLYQDDPDSPIIRYKKYSDE